MGSGKVKKKANAVNDRLSQLRSKIKDFKEEHVQETDISRGLTVFACALQIISEFYQAGINNWPRHKFTFNLLHVEKKQQARYVEKMIELTKNNPDRFEVSYGIDEEAYKKMLSELKFKRLSANQNKLELKDYLDYAEFIEETIFITINVGIIKTDHEEYNFYKKKILTENKSHKSYINQIKKKLSSS